MVGDNYDVDILIPKQLGILGVWIKNPLTSSRYPMEKEPPNTLALENIWELPILVGSLFKNSL